MSDPHGRAGDDLTAGVAAAAERSGWAVRDVHDLPDAAGASGLVGDERHLLLTSATIERQVDHPVTVTIHADSATVIVHSIVPRRFDPETRSTVMEYLTRANSGLVDGNFELDLDDGEVRFKTTFRAVEPGLVGAAFEHALAFNVTVFDVYRAGLERAADGSVTAMEAIAAVEAGAG